MFVKLEGLTEGKMKLAKRINTLADGIIEKREKEEREHGKLNEWFDTFSRGTLFGLKIIATSYEMEVNTDWE